MDVNSKRGQLLQKFVEHWSCWNEHAINGLAGSNLQFYQDFARFFQSSRQLHVTTNYRSATSIVDISNALMEGLGTPACAHKTMSGLVAIADLATFEPTPKEAEDHPGDSVTPAIVRLAGKAITDGKNVVLLSRKHSLPWYVNYGERRSTFRDSELDSFLRLVRSHLPPELGQMVTISTVHAYKGLQKKVVLVLDAVPRCYPLLHPDLIFSRCCIQTGVPSGLCGTCLLCLFPGNVGCAW